ncbi:hypothetical protein DID76_00960 [Candidatus Marinamargulisbacteria bacterium SCGC AG-414-C22]|nr:hypothetical protein DID76_00960 [Candidatus Marinamargulisbacteria bacterium SCGC AG-414-C22]
MTNLTENRNSFFLTSTRNQTDAVISINTKYKLIAMKLCDMEYSTAKKLDDLLIYFQTLEEGARLTDSIAQHDTKLCRSLKFLLDTNDLTVTVKEATDKAFLNLKKQLSFLMKNILLEKDRQKLTMFDSYTNALDMDVASLQLTDREKMSLKKELNPRKDINDIKLRGIVALAKKKWPVVVLPKTTFKHLKLISLQEERIASPFSDTTEPERTPKSESASFFSDDVDMVGHEEESPMAGAGEDNAVGAGELSLDADIGDALGDGDGNGVDAEDSGSEAGIGEGVEEQTPALGIGEVSDDSGHNLGHEERRKPYHRQLVQIKEGCHHTQHSNLSDLGEFSIPSSQTSEDVDFLVPDTKYSNFDFSQPQPIGEIKPIVAEWYPHSWGGGCSHYYEI